MSRSRSKSMPRRDTDIHKLDRLATTGPVPIRWHVTVRALLGGSESYVRVTAYDYVEAGERAKAKAAKRFRKNGNSLHIYGREPDHWNVIWMHVK